MTYPPRVQKFLDQHPGMSFDECFNLVEHMIQEKDREANGQQKQ